MDIEQGLFRQLVLWLLENSEPAWDRDDLSELYGLLQRHQYHPVDDPSELERELDPQGPLRTDLLARRKFIYLRPVGDDLLWLPLLTLCCDFGGPRPIVRLYLGMFALEDSQGDQTLRSVGFRFETPEGEGGGRHDFYHCQMITHFGHRDKPAQLQGVPPWMPTSQPSIPVAATAPLKLLVALLISVYDASVIDDLQTTKFAKELKGHLPAWAVRQA